MSPFGFFKKKEKSISKLNENIETSKPLDNSIGTIITIDSALDEIQKKEDDILRIRLDKLQKICKDLIQSFEIINNIAEKIEMEKVDEEVEKLTPLINNTKNIIVKSLKRESSNELQIPETYEDLVKFKETIDSSIKRFGEVTSSHSVVINNFMKKHGNSLRNELKKITENSEKLNNHFESIIKYRKIILECRNKIKDVKDIFKDNKTNKSIIDSINNSIQDKKSENDIKEKEIIHIKQLPSYNKSLDYLKNLNELKVNQKDLIQKILDISTQMSKAFHKYSYGTSKGTKELINTLTNDPMNILNDKEVEPYIEFLNNLKDSIDKKKIILKDGAKIMQCCELLKDALPKFSSDMEEINLKIISLKNKNIDSDLKKVKEIEKIIDENNKNIQNEILRKTEFNNIYIQSEQRLKQSLHDIEFQLYEICEIKYTIDLTL